ncbi:MAG: hydroxyacid dehydrogenase [Planctomycetota bacterium]|nr:MAG: hydroxyacid dehydrogenase [Planctomycetota bacterium]
MKVLIADKLDASCIQELKDAGCEVIFDPALKEDALVRAVRDSHCRVLVVRSTKVTADVFEAGDQLGVVVRAGAGVNTIDLDAASRRSVLVANCPGKNAVAVAELTFGLMLALDRRIVENTVDLKNGVWNKKLYSEARGLKGRTLGILGLGAIGRAVAERAKAFGMNVVAWSRSLTPETAEALDIRCADSPRDVAGQCDILTIHVAAAPETKNLVDADVLAALKPGSSVINTARADVLDYDALAKAVREKQLRVALDVYPNEPAATDKTFPDNFLQQDGILYGTHHIGASTEQAQQAIARETVSIVKEYARTGRVRNCVNLQQESIARYVLIVRHLNRPGVLAHTLNAVSHAGINVEEMENVICAGAESACAQIKLDGPLDEETLRKIRRHEHVIAVIHAPARE